MKNSITIIIAFLGVLLFTNVQSQDDLPSEEIEVVKDFKARLVKARKFNLAVPASMPDTTQLEYKYEVSAEIPNIEYSEPSIKPTTYKNPPPEPTYRGFVRGGYGLPQSIIGDVSYHLVATDNVDVAIFGKHESANDKDVRLMKYMDNDGGVKASWDVAPALLVQGDFRYSYDNFNYYADVPDLPIYRETGRTYKTFTGEIGGRNSESLNGDINYSFNAKYISHKDDLGVSESGLIADIYGSKKFAGKHIVALELKTDISTLNDLESRKVNNYSALPTYTLQGDKYQAKAGARVAYDSEKLSWFPVIDLSYKVLDNKVIAFAGSNGDLRKNNFYTLSTYNPFIHDQISQIGNTSFTSVYAGAKGRVSYFEYSGKFSYDWVKDLALFVQDERDIRKFQPLYDDGKVFKIEGEVKATFFERLNVGLSAAKMFYSMDTELKAWHLPGFEGRLHATYTLLDGKLRLRADMFSQTGIWYIRDDGFGDTLSPLFDISVGGDWFFTENFGAFIMLNNVTGNNRERWYQYPTIGFQPMGGIMVRF